MENYDDINKTEPVLSNYCDYRIKYKKKPQDSFLSVMLIQLLVSTALFLIILLFKFMPMLEPAFNAVRNFLQEDVFESLKLFVRVY